MLFLVFLTLTSLCSAQDYDYDATPGKVTYKTMDDNPYLTLLNMDDDYPDIEYLQDIDADTGLMVRINFVTVQGSMGTDDSDETVMNICDFLSKALFEPASSQARYNMASPLGMLDSLCPIEAGVKDLTAYELPINVTTEDLGCGLRSYRMRLEAGNATQRAEAVMELMVDLNTAQNNETCIENSSGIVPMPSIAAGIVTLLLAIGFTD